MNPDTYHGRDDESDEPDPVDWPLGKPGRPYGVTPSPALGIEPWMNAEDVANMPRQQFGQTLAEWAVNRAAYIKRLRLRRDIAPAGATADGGGPVSAAGAERGRPLTTFDDR